MGKKWDMLKVRVLMLLKFRRKSEVIFYFCLKIGVSTLQMGISETYGRRNLELSFQQLQGKIFVMVQKLNIVRFCK